MVLDNEELGDFWFLSVKLTTPICEFSFYSMSVCLAHPNSRWYAFNVCIFIPRLEEEQGLSWESFLSRSWGRSIIVGWVFISRYYFPARSLKLLWRAPMLFSMFNILFNYFDVVCFLTFRLYKIPESCI